MPHEVTEAEAIDAALRKAPEVRVPANFRNRLLARLPESPGKARHEWAWPAVWSAAAAGFAPLVILGLRPGFWNWLQNPAVIITAVSMEAALSLIWFRRMLKTTR
jgi:hypothetical protein